MTQEDKDLLLKDLCTRLPYGVKYNYDGYIGCDYTMNQVDCNTVDCTFLIESVKPYLFPLSSMTEEQSKEYLFTKHKITKSSGKVMYLDSTNTINYYLKNHFDYQGLIEKGLAIDATGLNIY